MAIDTDPKPAPVRSPLGAYLAAAVALAGAWVVSDPELFMPDQKPFVATIAGENIHVDRLGMMILGGTITVIAGAAGLFCLRPRAS